MSESIASLNAWAEIRKAFQTQWAEVYREGTGMATTPSAVTRFVRGRVPEAKGLYSSYDTHRGVIWVHAGGHAEKAMEALLEGRFVVRWATDGLLLVWGRK